MPVTKTPGHLRSKSKILKSIVFNIGTSKISLKRSRVLVHVVSSW